jgi:hypothetical protein
MMKRPQPIMAPKANRGGPERGFSGLLNAEPAQDGLWLNAEASGEFAIFE